MDSALLTVYNAVGIAGLGPCKWGIVFVQHLSILCSTQAMLSAGRPCLQMQHLYPYWQIVF